MWTVTAGSLGGVSTANVNSALAVVQAAADYWGRYVSFSSGAVIDIEVDFSSLSGSTLASGGTSFRSIGGGLIQADPILELEDGVDRNGASSDIDITIDSDRINSGGFFFGLEDDANVPFNKIDLFSVMVHEIGHGLGYISFDGSSSTAVYDTFVSGGSFTGAAAVAAFGGAVPLASGLSHLASSLSGYVMTPSTSSGIREYLHEAEVRILQDIGLPILLPTSGADNLYGFASSENVSLLGGDDFYEAIQGNDSIHGGAGDDTILGGAGNDSLSGNNDNDSLEGGAGNDTISGGAGIDRFVFSSGDGDDVISDFGFGGSDLLQIDGYGGLFSSASDVLATASQVGSDVVFNLNGADSVRLKNVSLTSITQSDILLVGAPMRPTAGDDFLDGTSGANLINGLAGNDVITGLGGNDTLFGGAGADTLFGGSGFDDLRGDAGHDRISGGAGNDSLRGADGNDILIGGAGVDLLIGHGGIDTADYRTSTAAVTVSLQTVTQSGGDAQGDRLYTIEYIFGSAFGDRLTGDALANSIRGGAGNDLIVGGAGADTITGGSGNDDIRGDAGNDQISGGSGNDALRGFAGADILTGGAGVDLLIGHGGIDTADYSASSAAVSVNLQVVTQSGGDAQGDRLYTIENIVGSASHDTLTGDAGANSIRGEAGNDQISGAAGNDALRGFDGNDILTGGAGVDLLIGHAGTDTADYRTSAAAVTVNLQVVTQSGGDAQGDRLYTIENIIGSAFGDKLSGDALANFIQGDAGNDSLRGFDGADILAGGAGVDLLIGHGGIDTADYRTSAAAVTVNLQVVTQSGGDAQGDRLYTIENIIGSAFDDTLTGNAGANVIEGDAGNDAIFGNAGDDTFIFASGDDMDTVGDFTAGMSTDDIIALSSFGAAFDTFTEIFNAATESGGNTTIDFGNGDMLVLTGVAKADLHQDDFLFG